VKTLVPQIHGGILGRRDLPEHVAQMQGARIARSIWWCPTSIRSKRPWRVRELLKIRREHRYRRAGAARAAAKNHDFVAVVTEPAQYAAVLAEFAAHGGTTLALRRRSPPPPMPAPLPMTPHRGLVRRRSR